MGLSGKLKVSLRNKLIMLMWGAFSVFIWGQYKKIEPQLFPVTSNFVVTKQVQLPEGLAIWGGFDKIRGCTFQDLSAYNSKGMYWVDHYRHNLKSVNRRVGPQIYKEWVLNGIKLGDPFTLYVEHNCWTGSVFTTLYEWPKPVGDKEKGDAG